MSESKESNKSNNSNEADEANNSKEPKASGRFQYSDDELLEQPFDWKQARRLASYMKPYRKQLLPIIIAMMLVGAVTKLTVPLLISHTIDHALVKGGESVLLWMTLSMLGVYAVQWIANAFRIRYTNHIGQRVIYDLRFDLFSHIQQLSFRFFDKRPAGAVLVRVTNYVNSLQDLFTNGVVNLMMDCVQLLGIIIILLSINVKLGLAIIVTVPIMFLVSGKLRSNIRRSWQDVQIKQSRVNAHLNESIQGIKVTQAYTQERENIGFFDSMNESIRRSWRRASMLNQSFGPIIDITGAIGYCVLFWYGAHLIQGKQISVGMLVAFASYIGYFWEPITRMGQMYAQLLIAMASAERIFEFMDEKPTVSETTDAIELPKVSGAVKFDQVKFGYESDRLALKGISIDVQPGETIALVGHTGSGKSTIMNLLCRFYDTTEGRVLIDGIDVRDVTIPSLRSQIGIVMQDTFIFSGTIRDNIRFGKLDATDEEIEQVAKAVNAHEFIAALPRGYETEVQERGNVLSMGQRQLLSFARALLANPRILILDEATASIDTETELKIQGALKTLLANRTSFIVAHRLSTIRHADRILVLDHGEIKERGSHDTLMSNKSIYYGLIQAQYRFLNEVG